MGLIQKSVYVNMLKHVKINLGLRLQLVHRGSRKQKTVLKTFQVAPYSFLKSSKEQVWSHPKVLRNDFKYFRHILSSLTHKLHQE